MKNRVKKELTHLSLFTGIGGLDLAAEWAGIESIGQCEYADYPTKVLEKYWPDVERWKDIRTLTKESFYEGTGRRTVDIISGGFPCQPFSVAGKQRGKEDDRFLWPEMVRVIKELRPTWVVGENVAGIVKMALDDVLSDLEGEGYTTRTFLIPACGVGAPHRRFRTAIVGYAEHNGLFTAKITRSLEEAGRRFKEGKKKAGKPAGTGKPGDMQDVANTPSEGIGRLPVQQRGSRQESPDIVWCSEDVANTKSSAQRRLPGREEKKESRSGIRSKDEGWERREERWATEPNVGRVANGVPFRVDRLRCLGNAVVPQQFYPVFQAIAEIERGNESSE